MCKKACKCECGYRCGGPGFCKLDPLECLQKVDGKHFVRDCTHEFTGWVKFKNGGSQACKHCGITACDHDCMVGP